MGGILEKSREAICRAAGRRMEKLPNDIRSPKQSFAGTGRGGVNERAKTVREKEAQFWL